MFYTARLELIIWLEGWKSLPEEVKWMLAIIYEVQFNNRNGHFIHLQKTACFSPIYRENEGRFNKSNNKYKKSGLNLFKPDCINYHLDEAFI